jgi:hypothetical protein
MPRPPELRLATSSVQHPDSVVTGSLQALLLASRRPWTQGKKAWQRRFDDNATGDFILEGIYVETFELDVLADSKKRAVMRNGPGRVMDWQRDIENGHNKRYVPFEDAGFACVQMSYQPALLTFGPVFQIDANGRSRSLRRSCLSRA